MSQSERGSATRTGSRPSSTFELTEAPSVNASALLELLGDEHARQILETISEEAVPARDIAERLDMSRATVYRRLNRLEAAGVVEAAMTYDPNGNHRKQFESTLDRVTLAFENGQVRIDDIERPGATHAR